MAASVGNLYFEVQREKVHFLCDFPEDATPVSIKNEVETYLGVPVNRQLLKMQQPESSDWVKLDDNKKLVDQGYNGRVAKADNPAVVALVVLNEDEDINIARISSPPPMPDAMRARDAPEAEN
uniref:Ubiquitin-like domain-containing protein n=1 Tax=Panagrellus redivivus TaxID=6233 RepID=A0A7E4V598_PANRE